MPITANISVPIGDTRTIALVITKSDATPLDLTGAAIQFAVSASLPASGVFLIQKTIANGGVTITNAAGGLANVSILPADTLPLAAAIYFFDVLVTGAGNVKSTVTQGQFVLTDHPSR